MKYDNIHLIDKLAAEYVLGTMHGQARNRFKRLMVSRPEINKAVRAWELRLNKLAGKEPPVKPPHSVWPAIKRRLDPIPAPQSPWYERLVFWRGLALGSGLLSAVLMVFLLLTQPLQNSSNPEYILVLQNQQADPVWLLSADQEMATVKVSNLKPIPMPKNKGCMLWLQPAESDAMYALGQIPDDGGNTQLPVQADMRKMLQNGKLIVTIEDLSKLDPASPSGQIEYYGRMAPLQRI